MKKLILSMLLCGVAACQHKAPTNKAAGATPRLTRPNAPVAAVKQPLPSLFDPADTLTAPMRAVLAAHDLSPLWANTDALNSEPDPSFKGFFGPDNYRFEMVFSAVKRDAADPAIYHVRGKSRYFKTKNIRAFSGILTVRRLADLRYPGFLQHSDEKFAGMADSAIGRTYTAHARLQLREETQENSGVFEGEALLDFFVVPSQKADYVGVYDHEGFDDRLPTRGGKLLLHGSRLNLTTGQVKSFLVGPNVGAIAPRLFQDFMLDERMGQINPKYAKLGWSNYWENDEWWADSPKPALHL